MGRIVGPKVAARFGRSILELGGNNAGIVCPSADLDMALRAIAAQGINPLVNTRGPEGRTCGECVHRQLRGGHAKYFPKCDLGPATSGPKTDVRASWPACHRFEEKTQ